MTAQTRGAPIVLLTGFEPFGGASANPSGDALRTLAAEGLAGLAATLVTAVLPVTFAGAATRIRELIATHRPDIVIATGLAGGRSAIGVERVAVNLLDARIPDNAGDQPVDLPSVEGAPAAAFATVPVKAIAASVTALGIPAEVSYSAGTFVCNHVFFTALDAASAHTRVGFVHVPWATGQAPVGAPELPPADIVRALQTVIAVAADGAELVAPGGTLH